MSRPFNIQIQNNQHINAIYEPPSALQTKTNARGVESKVASKRSAIIMLHDFPNGHKDALGMLYPDIATQMAGHGFASIRFDFRGCGDSSGMPQDFNLGSAQNDLRYIMDWLRKEHNYHHYVLVAQGLSAQIPLRTFSPGTISSIVMLWPNIYPPNSHLGFLKGMHKQPGVERQGYVESEGNKYGHDLIVELSRDLNLQSLLETISCPVLIQHGRHDKEVPIRQLDAVRMYMTRAKIELGLFEKGTNTLPDEAMRKVMLMNIEQFLKKIP